MTDQLKEKQRNRKLRLKKRKEGQRIMWEKSRVRRILRRWTRGEEGSGRAEMDGKKQWVGR